MLRENADAIVEQWLEAAKLDPELSRVSSVAARNTDYPRAILEELASRADSLRMGISEGTRKAAHIYGQRRREQGYRPDQIVAEARLLYNVVSKTLQGHLHSIDYNTIVTELMLFGNTLHEQLQESVRSFEEETIRRAV